MSSNANETLKPLLVILLIALGFVLGMIATTVVWPNETIKTVHVPKACKLVVAGDKSSIYLCKDK